MWQRLLILGFTVFSLVSCNKKKTTFTPGHRVAILGAGVQIAPDPDAQNMSVDVDAPQDVTDWPGVAYSPAHMQPHAVFNAMDMKGLLWKTDVGQRQTTDRRLVMPLVSAEGKIFAFSADERLTCLDQKTGKSLWSFKKSASHAGFSGGGIAYAEGYIYVTSTCGYLFKLDADTGKVVFEVETPYPLRSAPTVLGDKVYVISTGNYTLCFSTDTGELLWTHGGLDENVSLPGAASPAVTPFVVLSAYTSGEIHALYPLNGFSVWSDSLGRDLGLDSKSVIAQIRAEPVIDGQMVFVLSNAKEFIALDLRTGERLWSKPIGGLFVPLVFENFIFVMDGDNTVVCMTKDSGRIVWIRPLPAYKNTSAEEDPIRWAGPIMAGNSLIVLSSKGDLYRINPATGDITDTLAFEDTGFSVPPIVVDGVLYALNDRSQVMAIQ